MNVCSDSTQRKLDMDQFHTHTPLSIGGANVTDEDRRRELRCPLVSWTLTRAFIREPLLARFRPV